jgi:hypothetical protein
MDQLPGVFVLMVFGACASLYLARAPDTSKPLIYGIGLVSLLAQIGVFMVARV